MLGWGWGCVAVVLGLSHGCAGPALLGRAVSGSTCERKHSEDRSGIHYSRVPSPPHTCTHTRNVHCSPDSPPDSCVCTASVLDIEKDEVGCFSWCSALKRGLPGSLSKRELRDARVVCIVCVSSSVPCALAPGPVHLQSQLPRFMPRPSPAHSTCYHRNMP